MKIVRGKGDKVMILRNKRKGLRLLVREDINFKISSCQNDCYLWNNPLCNKKNLVEKLDYGEIIILLKTNES